MTDKAFSLKPYHSFGLEVYADNLLEFKSIAEFKNAWFNPEFSHLKKLILGGGSNVLFTQNFSGLVLINRTKGISLVKETTDSVWLEVASGEVWHHLVLHAIEAGWGGIENLALIPGTVGAAPMQNIGAYGVEVKSVIEKVNAIHLQTGEMLSFSNADCKFGYRESVFKHELKNQAFITSVTFKLSKQPNLNTTYGSITQELQNMGIVHPGIREVALAVINIRQSKLPDPKVKGNAGSFFKNPEIQPEHFEVLSSRFPEMPHYPGEGGKIKIPAGWLIEKSGWKGKTHGGAACHQHQALVLINNQNATPNDLVQLSTMIQQDVFNLFQITLNPEVNFIS